MTPGDAAYLSSRDEGERERRRLLRIREAGASLRVALDWINKPDSPMAVPIAAMNASKALEILRDVQRIDAHEEAVGG